MRATNSLSSRTSDLSAVARRAKAGERSGIDNHRRLLCGALEPQRASQLRAVVMGPGVRRDDVASGAPSTPPSHRAAPMLERRPHAARQAEFVDRGGAAERLEAVQFDAAPLEAALLQYVARGRVGHAGACEQMLAGKLLEEIVDHRARSFSAETLAPMFDAQPVAELGRFVAGHVEADHAEGFEI